jgi:mannose-6-phosphate isomerase
MSELMYPYVLQPKMAPAIWGGGELVTRFGKEADPHGSWGESWECWDENRVRNGPLAGSTLGELRARLGSALMGELGDPPIFPILTKIITARDWLSVQVHPNDAYAQRVEAQPNGKTECWYVLEAQPGAQLVMGWNRQTGRDEYERRVADGTLGEILNRVSVRPGDAFYIPAGMVHAIGAGITLYETQQASDLTYRMFDWNRIGTDGKPRQLHIEKAADVLNYVQAPADPCSPEITYASEGFARTALIADPHFLVERVTATETPATMSTRSRPLIVTALGEGLHVRCNDVDASLRPYETAVIPAGADQVTIGTASSANFMCITPAPTLEGLQKRFSEAGVALPLSERFLLAFGHLAQGV